MEDEGPTAGALKPEVDRPLGVAPEGEDEEDGEADDRAASGGGMGSGVGVWGGFGVNTCSQLCRRCCNVERFISNAQGFRWDWAKALAAPTVPMAVVTLPIRMQGFWLPEVHFKPCPSCFDCKTFLWKGKHGIFRGVVR